MRSILFHILDPQEIGPTLRDAAVLVDLETEPAAWKSRPTTRAREYRGKMDAHIDDLRDRSRGRRAWTISCCRPIARSTPRCAST